MARERGQGQIVAASEICRGFSFVWYIPQRRCWCADLSRGVTYLVSATTLTWTFPLIPRFTPVQCMKSVISFHAKSNHANSEPQSTSVSATKSLRQMHFDEPLHDCQKSVRLSHLETGLGASPQAHSIAIARSRFRYFDHRTLRSIRRRNEHPAEASRCLVSPYAFRVVAGVTVRTSP